VERCTNDGTQRLTGFLVIAITEQLNKFVRTHFMSEENKMETNRKPNPNNIPQPGDDGQKKKPRFNIYWIYGIAFAALIGWNLSEAYR
jgi:hypothetical protein